MASIKIETGLKVYEIEDENGNIRGTISFNPSDVNFLPRARETFEFIENELKAIQEIKEELTEEKIIEIVENYDKKIKEQIDKLFDDENTSKVIFGNQNCLNTLKGITFVERFLNAFMPIIEKSFAEEGKKSREKIEKYTKQVID